ncbi:MAG: hypothetical protein MI757_07285 [Pirellulales bacterium]|nr:hypothetical protein [Pirellulales bacterium]
MEGRFSITFVVVFWLITMTWLMWTKVLPPLLVGEPPDYKAIVDQHEEDSLPAAWVVSCNGQRFGVAANRLERGKQMTRIHSYVKFDRLPLEEIPFLATAVATQLPQLARSEIRAHNTLLIDSLGRLVDLDSRLSINDVEVLRFFGMMNAGQMRITVASDFLAQQKTFDLPISAKSLLGDQLSPQDRLPGLHVGQKWTVPVYSVMGALFQQDGESPVEIAQARVLREELIHIGKKKVSTLLVVLGSDSGAGDREEKGRMWVDKDGVVLRQEMTFFGAKLRFQRCDAATSLKIFESIQHEWESPSPLDPPDDKTPKTETRQATATDR